MNVTKLLPEVFQSEASGTLFNATVNRLLTKDAVEQKIGYVGDVLVGDERRRLTESSPHRQLNQLAPVVYSQVGAQKTSMSFQTFLQRLSMMGIPYETLGDWAKTERFNWAPPVDMDKLINYQNYFWGEQDDTPQHITVENMCVKLQSRLSSYDALLLQHGDELPINHEIDFINNTITLQGKLDELFAPGFMFVTKNAQQLAIHDRRWIVDGVQYDSETDETIVTTLEPLAHITKEATEEPTPEYHGQLWLNVEHGGEKLYVWGGDRWRRIPQTLYMTADLTEQRAVYALEADMSCGGRIRWPKQMVGRVVDDYTIQLLIDVGAFSTWRAATEEEWQEANGLPGPLSLWYNDADQGTLYQFTEGDEWVTVLTNVKDIISSTPPRTPPSQDQTVWSAENKWRHRSELVGEALTATKRASLPIIEYATGIELSEWARIDYVWKYRNIHGGSFDVVDTSPNRLELEPVKSYIAEQTPAGNWKLLLNVGESSAAQDINLTDVFVPGYQFRIVNGLGFGEIYTTKSSTFRQIYMGDADAIQSDLWKFVTEVEVVETEFLAPLTAGLVEEYNAQIDSVPMTRIEPLRTSRGDIWDGYHAHWCLDDTATTIRATQAQAVNPSNAVDFRGIVQADRRTVVLHSDYHFAENRHTTYALANDSNLHVYVNGVRQYGTYKIEEVRSVAPDYTIVDKVGMILSAAPVEIEYVFSIKFDRELAHDEVVEIVTSPQAFSDMGMFSVPVRTEAADDLFAEAVVRGHQPVYTNLVHYVKTEQNKTAENQYPMFNMYDIVTGEVVKSGPLFEFVEDEESRVHPIVGRRIWTADDGRDYRFQINLYGDEGEMLAYRVSEVTDKDYWYNPITETFLCGTQEGAWVDVSFVKTSTGTRAIRPIVSDFEPSNAMSGTIWVNTLANEFVQMVDGAWRDLSGVIVAETDPTLHTIWKKSKDSEKVRPRILDESGVEFQDGDNIQDFDWEIVSQWINNPKHESRDAISYTELHAHFKSIIEQQPHVPGLVDGGIFSIGQHYINYGLGGTIHEHNNSFDRLISAINTTGVTPLGVIEFAGEQYEACISLLRDAVAVQIIDTVSDDAYDFSVDAEYLEQKIIADAFDRLNNNEFLARVYKDTTAANAKVKYWVTTAPMIGAVKPTQPHISRDGNRVRVFHHDGHISDAYFTVVERDRMLRQIVKQMNATVPGSAVTSATEPQMDVMVWYKPGRDAVLRKAVKGSSGVRYWTSLDLTDVLGKALLDVEEELYQISVEQSKAMVAYNESDYHNNPQLRESMMKQRFINYSIRQGNYTPSINTQYIQTDSFTWNYKYSEPALLPYTTAEVEQPASWMALYKDLYNTAYPHEEPWKLQGYDERPLWWEAMYRDDTGMRVWKYDHTTRQGMWGNIFDGIIPVGCTYPSGKISSGDSNADGEDMPVYSYVSVNVLNYEVGGYKSDALLPPYFNNQITNQYPEVRSIYTDLSEIESPDADYVFGDGSLVEMEWRESASYIYDVLAVDFMLQPVRFLQQLFGSKYVEIDGLQVDVELKKIASHHDTLFHGDMVDDKVYQSPGMNQWYVNFNRFSGYDSNKRFRAMWTEWDIKQSYQTDSIMSAPSLRLFNQSFDVTENDFEVLLTKSGIIDQVWSDAFKIELIKLPRRLLTKENRSEWMFNINTLSTLSREVKMYGTQLWPVTVSEDGLFTAFNFDVIGTSATTQTVEVRGDQSHFAEPGVSVIVNRGQQSERTDIITDVFYNPDRDITRLVLEGDVTGAVSVIFNEYSHNWLDGFEVVLLSDEPQLPYPFSEMSSYLVKRVDEHSFRLADSVQSLLEGTFVTDVFGSAKGLKAGKLHSTFDIHGDDNAWYHLELNKGDVRTVTMPGIFKGLQTVIDIVHGYQEYQRDNNVVFNDDTGSREVDPDETGMVVSWQTELIKFLTWTRSVRDGALQVEDKYDFRVIEPHTGLFEFTSYTPGWKEGQALMLSVTGGQLPTPLSQKGVYYFAPVEGDVSRFRLTVSPRTSGWGDITLDDDGTGIFYASRWTKSGSQHAEYVLNPSQRSIWINTPQGMLSDIIYGPHSDIRISQTIFNDEGKELSESEVVIHRQDEQTRIGARDNGVNRLGGGKFYVESFEHIISFNNYTEDGVLVYDPFLGLAAKTFEIDFIKAINTKQRPSMGGYFLTEGGFVKNLEGTIQDLRNAYDIIDVTEHTKFTDEGRRLLNWEKGQSTQSLDRMRVNNKTQFQFYRGMLHAKGSNDAVSAFVNSKAFEDASLDEFWAYRIGTFGGKEAIDRPQLKLMMSDRVNDTLRFRFDEEKGPALGEYDDQGYEYISINARDRWVNHPEQRDDLIDVEFLDAEINSITKVLVVSNMDVDGVSELAFSTDVDVVAVEETAEIWYNNGGEWTQQPCDVRAKVVIAGHLAVQTPTIFDDVRVLSSRVVADRSNSRLTSTTTLILDEIEIFNAETVNIPLFFEIEPEEPEIPEVEGCDCSDVECPVCCRLCEDEEDPSPDEEFEKEEPLFKAEILTIATINIARDVVDSPIIRDVKSQAKMYELSVWHPALGFHAQTAIHNVDIEAASDPARYTVSVDVEHESTNPWQELEVGTVWLDTSQIAYVPYYDPRVMTDHEDRVFYWGDMQDWCQTKMYQWVETTTPPDSWSSSGQPRVTLFNQRRRHDAIEVGIDGIRLASNGNRFKVGDEVLVIVEGVDELEDRRFWIESVEDNIIKLEGVDVSLSESQFGRITKPFDGVWVEHTAICDRFFNVFGDVVEGSVEGIQRIYLTDPKWRYGDQVSIYLNGYENQDSVFVEDDEEGKAFVEFVEMELTKHDVIDVVLKPGIDVDLDEEDFDNFNDDGEQADQWKEVSEYTELSVWNGESNVTRYFFWVEGSTERRDESDNTTTPIAGAVNELSRPQLPYLILTDVVQEQNGDVTRDRDMERMRPGYYKRAVIRNLGTTISEDERYVLEFIRNPNWRVGNSHKMNRHEQWVMIRRDQPGGLPEPLWRAFVEALMGVRYSNHEQRLPSFEREFYDSMNGTHTRIGLGPQQVFAEPAHARQTVVQYLQQTDVDFAPLDVDEFMERYPIYEDEFWDDPQSVYEMCAYLKSTVSSLHINHMFFDVLQDALAVKGQYDGLMKTSWLSLTGVVALDVRT